MWKKVEITRGRNLNGAQRVMTPRLQRSVTSGVARLCLPGEMVSANRFDVYDDGNGRIGVLMNPKGERSVVSNKKATQHQRFLTIPKKYAPCIPYGTHEATVTQDGGMLVIDLSQFNATQVAAE